MPIDTEILGFSNQWYAPAATNAKLIQLPSSKQIRMVSAPYFLITKLEAFEGRGDGDYLMSHDIEDIIAVLDGRPKIISDIKQAETELVIALSDRFKKLLEDNAFVDAVFGHMPTDETSQARVLMILKTIREIASLKNE